MRGDVSSMGGRVTLALLVARRMLLAIGHFRWLRLWMDDLSVFLARGADCGVNYDPSYY